MNSNTCSPSTSVLAEDSENSNLTGDFSIKAARNKRKSVGKENEPTKKTTKKTDQAKEIKSNYSIVTYLKEDHSEVLYNVQMYRPFEIDQTRILFVTVGTNRCSIYEYVPLSGKVELVDAFRDADAEEIYYTCAWTTDPVTRDPVVSIAGVKGIIRTLVLFKSKYKKALNGHGGSINDLKYHPSKDAILLSSSQDYTLRLWNIETSVCIAIIGGVEGHRDEVLSGDFNSNATLLISSSIDHSLKIWNINTPKLKQAIEDSETFTSTTKSFPTVSVSFPEFSTRDVHTNYIDYVRWFGDLVFSKSCENCVVIWKPGLLNDKIDSITRANKNVSILHTFQAKECDIWYVRFCLDFSQKNLALGTRNGKIYLWDLEVDDPKNIKKQTIGHNKSKVAIRQIAMSMNGHDIIAVNDEGYIFIWRKELQ